MLSQKHNELNKIDNPISQQCNYDTVVLNSLAELMGRSEEGWSANRNRQWKRAVAERGGRKSSETTQGRSKPPHLLSPQSVISQFN